MIDNFFIDYETFHDVKYSLRSPGMSYTDYILDERFEEYGAAVAVNKDIPKFLYGERLHDAIEDAKHKQMRFIGHNVLFDGMLTTIKHDLVFPKYFCTLAMVDAMYQGAISSGLDSCMKVLLKRPGKDDIIPKLKGIHALDIPFELWQRLKEYAIEDLRATQELYYTYSPHLPAQEHEIMDIVLKMACRPMLTFNAQTLSEAVQEADDEREAMMKAAIALGATEEILKGNKLFPEFLKERGIDVPMKPNPKGIMIPAFAKTDEGFQEMLESKDDEIRALAKGRLAVKSTQATTRSYRFKKLHEEMGVFPAAYNYARAHTWRITGANKLNAANLKRGSKLRTCLEAPKGHVLGVADASQIECRGNGFIAGQSDLMALFKGGGDPYNELASVIFGRTIDRKHQDEAGNYPDFFEGFLGKTATLGLGFQMGGPKFKWTVDTKAKVDLGLEIDFDLNEANRIVYDVYRPQNWKIAELWDHCTEFLYAMYGDKSMYWDYGDDSLWIDGKNNKLFFPNGTWLYYPGLDCNGGDFTYLNKRGSQYITKYIYGGLFTENIAQKFARDITSHHMVQIAERYPVVLHTYDENVAIIPEAEAEEGTQWMIDLMKIPPLWAKSIPLDAEGGFAREYSK